MTEPSGKDSPPAAFFRELGKRCRLPWLLLSGLMFLCSCPERKKEKPPLTASVKRETLEVKVSAPGRLLPRKLTVIKSKAAGEIQEIFVNPGDTVQEGELLVRLDPSLEQAKREQAAAEYEAARAASLKAGIELRDARADLRRSEALYREGLLSPAEYEKKKNAVAALEKALQIAKSRERASLNLLQEADKRLSFTEIRAPLSGTVLEVPVSKGQVVSSGTSGLDTGTVLLTIADLSSLKVVAEVEETDVGAVAPGQDAFVEVDAFPGALFPAKVKRVAPEAVKKGPLTVVEVELELVKSAAGLRPGMSVNVEIVTAKEENALVVPVSAVLSRNGRSGVVVLEDGGTEWREVKLGPGDWERVSIISGLTAGELVVLPPGSFPPSEQ